MPTRDYTEKFQGLSKAEQTVLLYSIVCTTYNGRNPLNFEMMASELGYTITSAKVTYGNARRKLIKATGIDPGRKPHSRHTAPVSAGAVDGMTNANPMTSNANADSAALDPSTAAEEGEGPKTPRKGRRTAALRKRKASEMDEGDRDGEVEEDDGCGVAVAEA
ncbi:hypothetical protein F1880_009737 [Penicillium rolfsii]|nr:hypothetical protein F1880_009737 [Penicillium rolfsii]